MDTSYGVVWKEGDHPLARGKLELLPRALRLEGTTGSEPTTREIAYDYLSDIHIGRTAEERIGGHPSLVLEPRAGDRLTIASVAQTGVVAEIAERLAALQFNAPKRVAIIVPLREDASDAVRALLAEGPPFDPETLDLKRHLVFLTPSEVVFMFESTVGADALEPLLQDPKLWRSVAAWHDFISGPPRIAEDVFSWERAERGVDRSLLPPGLRWSDSLDP